MAEGGAHGHGLASNDGHGLVTSRAVLLKALDENGFVFTNIHSTKGRQIMPVARPRLFLWTASGCQVQLAGTVSQVSDAAADAYFETRDRGSQVGSWASAQSAPLDSRETLMQRVRELEHRFEGQQVPRPPFWTGFALSPERVEFWWRGVPLHDRFEYTLGRAVEQAG
jgi:pyridoxamine 5'-phosphate oxidase